MSKKRKRRISRDELRQMSAPTEDFEFVNPNDEDDIIVVTAQRLSPGHLLHLGKTSLIRAYTENDATDEASTDAGEDDNFNQVIQQLEYAAEVASLSVIDPETGETLYTKEDCQLYFLPAWNTQIANFALTGARPQQEGEDADAVDGFPEDAGGQEKPELEAHQE